MAGIPTSNILQPGNISIIGGVNRALISALQLLKPQWYNTYVEKYGNEDFTWWLATYGGMEEVKNQQFFWFENRGKLMPAISNLTLVTTPAAGATVTITLSPGDHYNSGTQTAARVGETLRIASNNVEGTILTVTPTVNAFVITVAPKQTTQAFAGSTGSLLAGEVLLFGGDMDAGEASDSIEPMIHLDQQYLNTITEMRDSWSATDLAEMAEVYYDSGVTGEAAAGGMQAGTSYFTYKGLVKSNTRFKNDVEFKLMRGNIQNNTNIPGGSVGTQGLQPKIAADGETIGITPGTLDIAKMHEITRIMDVNGCANQCIWLQDIFLNQDFQDGIFKEFPAGAFVWGQGEKSEAASVAYGFRNIWIDNYMIQTKKYKQWNTEVTTGKTPTVDFFRYYGNILPQGETRDAKDVTKAYKNMTVMFQQPPAGGTIGNGIRVWEHGGGSRNPTSGKMKDNIEQICYRGLRLVAANQFIQTISA